MRRSFLVLATAAVLVGCSASSAPTAGERPPSTSGRAAATATTGATGTTAAVPSIGSVEPPKAVVCSADTPTVPFSVTYTVAHASQVEVLLPGGQAPQQLDASGTAELAFDCTAPMQTFHIRALGASGEASPYVSFWVARAIPS